MSRRKQGSPTDIADRLKAAAYSCKRETPLAWDFSLDKLLNEAADEIEALRFRLAIMHDELETLGYERKERT